MTKKVSKLLKILFKVIFCHLIQKIQKKSKRHKNLILTCFFAFSTGIYRTEKRRKKLNKGICEIYPDHKSEI